VSAASTGGSAPARESFRGTETDPPVVTWLRTHYLLFAGLVFLPMAVLALALVDDYRAALIGGTYASLFILFWMRPGGLGDRLGRHQAREFEQRGELGVRPGWLVRNTLLVVAAVLLVVLVGALWR
jgi:hypothetical protein